VVVVVALAGLLMVPLGAGVCVPAGVRMTARVHLPIPAGVTAAPCA